ncbi:hypothetical protein F5Y17DRAFT_207325 [Xylariaceae sp. FL0594]|nr:hypothetical protein F5Y17DRAFT_207325 [Xylariaceae sp. FL0594]
MEWSFRLAKRQTVMAHHPALLAQPLLLCDKCSTVISQPHKNRIGICDCVTHCPAPGLLKGGIAIVKMKMKVASSPRNAFLVHHSGKQRYYPNPPLQKGPCAWPYTVSILRPMANRDAAKYEEKKNHAAEGHLAGDHPRKSSNTRRPPAKGGY